jgi:HKD family nuclease
MSLGKIFSRAETIGGLEINNDALRFSLLKKGRSGLEAEILVEEKLTGKEQSFESPEFAAKLIKFAKKNKIEYVILSVPSDGIFVKTYAFPVSMSDEKIIDSMGLTVDLQLPKKKDEI